MDRCAKEGKGRAGTPGMRGTQPKRGGVPGWWGSSRRLHVGKTLRSRRGHSLASERFEMPRGEECDNRCYEEENGDNEGHEQSCPHTPWSGGRSACRAPECHEKPEVEVEGCDQQSD